MHLNTPVLSLALLNFFLSISAASLVDNLRVSFPAKLQARGNGLSSLANNRGNPVQRIDDDKGNTYFKKAPTLNQARAPFWQSLQTGLDLARDPKAGGDPGAEPVVIKIKDPESAQRETSMIMTNEAQEKTYITQHDRLRPSQNSNQPSDPKAWYTDGKPITENDDGSPIDLIDTQNMKTPEEAAAIAHRIENFGQGNLWPDVFVASRSTRGSSKRDNWFIFFAEYAPKTLAVNARTGEPMIIRDGNSPIAANLRTVPEVLTPTLPLTSPRGGELKWSSEDGLKAASTLGDRRGLAPRFFLG